MRINICNIDDKYCFDFKLDNNFSSNEFYKDIVDIYSNSNSYEDFLINFITKFERNISKHNEDKNQQSIDIYIYETYMIYMLYNSFHNLVDARKYFNNKFNVGVGNCVDKFLDKAINKNIFTIESFVKDIQTRQKERTHCLDYHNTGTYEKDFRQIIEIKNVLSKMLKNCDKQLEMMSEKYTSLV